VELRDLIVTPLLLMVIYATAYLVRPYVTDDITRRYFIPALTLRIVGALALGIIYQFYYSGGDTYNYHTYGSRQVWEAFMDSPEKGVQLFFSDGNNLVGIHEYAWKIPMLKDPSSYNVIRVASFFDLFTFSTYSATAICFALLSFLGAWLLFVSFYKFHPDMHRGIAIATLFIPSVIFWGSGILKDTITLACLGMGTYFCRDFIFNRRIRLLHVLTALLAVYIIFLIKKYILLCFLPALVVMFFGHAAKSFQNPVLRLLLLPVIILITGFAAYKSVMLVSEDDRRYSVDQLANTAKVTAYDIAFQTGRDAGSTYALGELDGSFGSMLRLAPQAINVSLFRPYLWEVRNPLMLISALESTLFLLASLYIVGRYIRHLPHAITNPDVLFCLVFSVSFAFAVGVSTFNFGTLSRYKIPLLPFYMLSLVFLHNYSKRDRNRPALERTE
jgi:hypothetical protein